MSNTQLKDVAIENAKFVPWGTNFAGRASANGLTPEGVRTFGIMLDPDTAEMMAGMGMNVKISKPKPEYDAEPFPYINVKVRYDKGYPPKIWMITSKGKTLLDEDTVGQLDVAEISNVDVIIHPSNYTTFSGATGVAAYCKTMYVTIVEDIFANKYFDGEN